LLAVLREAGVIDSTRGRSGGYRLARPPAEIRLGSLLETLGEPLYEDPSFCDRHAGTEAGGPCVNRDACTLRALWRSLEQWMQCFLDRITLADLLQNEGQVNALFQASLAGANTALPLIRLTPKPSV
jgi:Rrf2 family protein